jgi:hypothetical protein
MVAAVPIDGSAKSFGTAALQRAWHCGSAWLMDGRDP